MDRSNWVSKFNIRWSTVKVNMGRNKKAQLWLTNPRDATAFQIHPEEIHRNDDDDDDDDFSFTSRRTTFSAFIMVT